MPNPTASAVGGAMPAEGLKTRRAALGALATFAALAVPSLAASSAAAADIDAPLFELLDKWRAARARTVAANERFWEAEELADIEPPAALIKTEADKKMFFSDNTPVGKVFSDDSVEFLNTVVAIVGLSKMDRGYLREVCDRYMEIRDAHDGYAARVEAARKSVGYYEFEAEQESAQKAEDALRRDVGNYRARTVNGLLAKTTAIADDWGHSILEGDTKLEEGKVATLDAVALTVLRDCAAIMGSSVAGLRGGEHV